MQSKARTVNEYMASLPPERRVALQAVREEILKNLGPGYEEGMQYGMIGYYVPHEVYPPGYHCDPKQPLPFAGLASQKNYMSIYLMCVYGVPEQEAWFREQWARTGKKLDMGKGCVRFRKLDDLPLPVIGRTIKRVPSKKFVAFYDSVRPGGPKAGGTGAGTTGATAAKKKAKPASKKASTAKVVKKTAKKVVKKTASKKTAKKKTSAGKAQAKKPAARKPAKKKAARRG